MCCTYADLEFTDAGIIVLNGENGSGKSSALDAIAICLCEHKRADKYNDFVQKGFNEAEVKMSCTLNDEPLFFDIKLHYSKGAALERDVTYKGVHYLNSEASQLLEQLDLPFYSTIIFSMQGDADVASMSPVTRASFLQKLLQFDFNKQSLDLKTKIDNYEDTKNYNSNQIEFITNNLKNKVQREVEDLPFTEEEKQKKYERNILLTRQLGIKSLLYEDKDRLIEKQRNITTQINSKEREIALYKQWEDSNVLLKEAVTKAEENLKNVNTDDLTNYDTDFDAQQKIVDDTRDKVHETQALRDKAFENISDFKSQLKTLQDKDALLKEGKCPHCGQSTSFLKDEHIDEAIKKVTDDLNKNKELLNKCDADLMQFRHISFTAQDELVAISERRSKAEQNLKAKQEAVENAKAQLERAQLNAPKINEWPEDLDKQLSQVNIELNKLNQQLKDTQELENEQQQITSDLTKYNEIERKNNWIIEENKKQEKEVEESKDKITSLQKNNIELTNVQKDYAEARKIIDTDLPNFLIVKTCGRLEQEMNNFIQVVFPTMQVRLFQNKKGVEFFYTRDEKANSKVKAELINTKMASGFEKSLLSIAFKVALCRAYNLSFTVLDEIDAFATDTSSEKIFQSLIDSKTFDQIFIITHKPSTREVIRDIAQDSIFYHVEKGKFTLEDR